MKKTILLLAILGLALSCSSDDDTGVGQFEAFNLKVYTPNPFFDADTTINYNDGDIVWNFNFGSNQVEVSISEGIEPVRLPAGMYNFTLNDNVCNYADNKYFHVADDIIGLLILDNYGEGSITISDACIDGPIYVFERD